MEEEPSGELEPKLATVSTSEEVGSVALSGVDRTHLLEYYRFLGDQHSRLFWDIVDAS